MIPCIGTPPDPARRYKLRPGAYAILPMGQKFLLTFQSAPQAEVQLPGGGIDPGEGPVQALHREVFEETGWKISQPRRLGAFRRYTYMPEYDLWAEKLCTVFLARPALQVAQPSEPDHTTLVLGAADALASLGNAGDRHFLARYLG